MGKKKSAKINDEDVKEDEPGGPKSGKVKVRYVESKHVKDMREDFERKEKTAQRSSRTYRYLKSIEISSFINDIQ